MENNHEEPCFRCPEFIPPGAPDDFCIDEECCPEKLPTPKFPSPTTCLPEKVQQELEERIGEVNRLLLDLALSGEQPEEARRRIFDGLVKQLVRVKLNCEGEGKKAPARKITSKKKRIRKKQQKAQLKNQLKGCVQLVGWNFLHLKNEQKNLIIPFENICLVKPEGHFMEREQGMELHDIDPCFRRALTFRFGETVASSPQLVQLFFRLRLSNFLLLLIDEKIQLITESKRIKGTVFHVTKETVAICAGENKYDEIPLGEICYILMEDRHEVC